MANWRRCGLVLLATSLALTFGCSSRSGLGDNSDCDYLVVPETGDDVMFQTVECDNSDLVLTFSVTVEFLGPTSENGGLGEPPDPTSLSQFRLEHYDVTYRNLTTGGTVAGVDVPAPMRVSVQEVFNLQDDEVLDLTDFPVLSRSAKASPPLNNDAFYPTDSGVVFDATLTWWGHPITDDSAWCYGTMHWVFTVIPC